MSTRAPEKRKKIYINSPGCPGTDTMEETMNYIGVDLHKDNMTIVGVNEKGDVFVKERMAPKCIGKIEEFFSQESLHPCKIVCESIGFYHWFYDLISQKVDQFILANPIETRKYSWNNPKTDFRDATKLALLLAGGEFERNKSLSCYIPDKVERAFRETTRVRFHLVRRKTSIINSARRIFLKNNLAGPKILNYSTLSQFINKYGDRFNEIHRKFLYIFAEDLFYLEKQISDIEREIHNFLSMERFARIHKILITIPGVGDMVSAVLISEIGNFRRFQDPEFLASYAGMVPKVFQSDQKIRYGKITKEGSVYIRYALVNASWVAVREDERIRRIFGRIAKRAGRKKAIVAIGRKILIWSWHLVIKNETWGSLNNEFPAENRSGMTLERVLNEMKKRDEFIQKNSVA